ncbi:hypothetical protein ADK86_27385 [Streptomyces sp. NRRL F-5755]|uniref:hypothetical protein n=1 Tax=Streptomyces sp. NRRL F-5755 TaxID=1519475 RepID=UPI0006AD9F29|nr:hypothetical protein [Streptomyces sp. NRRL F-5755]KOT90002.1 hypothetical protein ADK86_27385 [Streptomyces sp. NRRL F-5755]
MSTGQQQKSILIPAVVAAPVVTLLAIVNVTMTGAAQIGLMAVLFAALLVCVGFVAAGIARSRHE